MKKVAKPKNNRILRGKTSLLEVGIFNRGYSALDCFLQTTDGDRACVIAGHVGSGLIWTWPVEAPCRGPWTLTISRSFPNSHYARAIDAMVSTREVIPATYSEQTWPVT